MFQTTEILKRATDKIGLKRIKFSEKNIPTSIENIVVVPFFGDIRSSFILSNLLLKRIKDESKSSKYFILISWPDQVGLYPYVDEYWTVEDSNLDRLVDKVDCFDNNSPIYSLIVRELNHWFYDLILPKDLKVYYDNGITQEFLNNFKVIKTYFQSVPSIASIGIDFAKQISEKDLKIFVYPSKDIFTWKYNGLHKIRSNKDFWLYLVKKLVDNKFYPIVYKDVFCYDLSLDLVGNIDQSKWHQLDNQDILKAFGVMRSSCVLDIFNSISRYAIAARAPFICLDERNKFKGLKDYEINDLFAKSTPNEYVYGFANTLEADNVQQWDINIINIILSKLNKFIPNINRESLPSAVESEDVVLYESVRKYKTKKMGSKFIKIERD
jgi:hypothetical protein